MSKRNKQLGIGLGMWDNKDFWSSANDNEWSAIYYLNRLTELAMAMFEWKNLPDTIDWRFLEYTLYYDGKALWFYEDGLKDYVVTKCAMSGKMNFYRIPNKRRAYADNGYQKNLTEKDSVVIFNNMLRLPSYPAMTFYARKLWELDRVIDVNIKAQKTPVLILANEDERLTMKNVYQQYDGNQPFIFGSKNMGLKDNITVLKTDAPYLADKLMEQKNQIWNEAMTYLGISNVSYQKKERLISDEVTRSMGGTIASRQSRLEMRKEACDQINRMFGTNIDVDFREDYREFESEDMTEGSDNEDGKE
jgi:hypothetical protein